MKVRAHAPQQNHAAPQALRNGEGLPPAARGFFERRFGYDFSQVRIHHYPSAADSARSLHALAFTVGQDVLFASGQYRPHTSSGRRLIAHELAHTVQQKRAAPRESEGLEIEPAGSALEREADRAAGRAMAGAPMTALHRIEGTRIQRAEQGTYVSTVGPPEYLDAGAHFYRAWGYPNVQRVSTVDGVLTGLDKAKGPIDRFRIVSHGIGESLEIGLLPELSPGSFAGEQTEFTTEQRFRKELATASPRILDAATHQSWTKLLQQDAKTKPLMATLNAATAVPSAESALGIMLSGMFDAHALAIAEMPAGGKPKIANLGILNQYNQSRITTYRAVVIAETPQAQQAAVTKAIADLSTELAGALQRAKQTFTLDQSDADTLADWFLDPTSKKKMLSRTLTKEISEGAGGPYLKRLRSVRKKVTKDTHVEIRGCNIGARPAFMDKLRGYFGEAANLPSLSAPDLFQYFFQLNFQTVTPNPQDEANLLQAFQKKDTGLAEAFEDWRVIQAGEALRVVNEKTLAGVAQKYKTPSAAELKKLNPGITNPDNLTPGTLIWLKPRKARTFLAGKYSKLGDFCKDYIGDEYVWPKVWAANPQIKNPNALKPNDVITVPEMTPVFAEFLAKLRSAVAVPLINKETNKPVVFLDDPNRAAALGDWLAKQRWDPQGRSAAQLSNLYAGKGFRAATQGTYIEFLSRDYPNIVDPLFPDDPRYASHIIKRP